MFVGLKILLITMMNLECCIIYVGYEFVGNEIGKDKARMSAVLGD